MPTAATEPCLMIEMSDRRRIFTGRDNFAFLGAFARTFAAQVVLVAGDGVELFDLGELPAVVCDHAYRHPGTYTTLEMLLPRPSVYSAARPREGARRDVLTLAQAIRAHVRRAILDRQTVTLRSLREKYRESGLSTSCLSGHLNLVRRQMERDGFAVDSPARGAYRLRK